MADELKQDDVPMDKLMRVYVKIRDKRAELKAAFEQEDAALEAELDSIKRLILDACDRLGMDSVKTPYGTAIRTMKTRYWTQDWDAMYRFIREHDALHLLERRLAQKALEQFLEEHPDDYPPGLSADTRYDVTIRRNR